MYVIHLKQMRRYLGPETTTKLVLAFVIRRLQCESKKVAPIKLFAIFSLLVNLCN